MNNNTTKPERNEIDLLKRTLRKESRRLDWLINELEGWDRDNIDDAIDREETEELKREKLQADAKYDI